MPKGETVGLKLQSWMQAPDLTLVNLQQLVAMKVRPTSDDKGDIVGHGPDGKEWPLALAVPLDSAYMWIARASQTLNSSDAGGWGFGVIVPLDF
jgi:hypothetical protein